LQRLRLTIFWMHLICGVTAGLFISFFAITGALLAFEHPTLRHLELSYHIAATGPRIPLDAVLDNTRSRLGAAKEITVSADPRIPVELQIGSEQIYAVNPYTGEILGLSAPHARHFFNTVTALHKYFGTSKARHEQIRIIKGTVVGTLSFLVVSGCYLWLPRKWSRRRLKQGLFLRSDVTGRARNWNWHNALGIWVSVPLACLAFTGLIMTYPWIADVLLPATTNDQAAVANPSHLHTEHHAKHQDRTDATQVSLEQAFARVEQQDPHWQSIWLRLPSDHAQQLNFTVDRGTNEEPVQRDRVTIDHQTGDITRWQPFAMQNAQTRFRDWSRFLHTGEIGGIAGELLATLTCLVTLFVVWTGYALALTRLRLKLASSSRVPVRRQVAVSGR
jgi:uncharacterized iron-regulated membrane protein